MNGNNTCIKNFPNLFERRNLLAQFNANNKPQLRLSLINSALKRGCIGSGTNYPVNQKYRNAINKWRTNRNAKMQNVNNSPPSQAVAVRRFTNNFRNLKVSGLTMFIAKKLKAKVSTNFSIEQLAQFVKRIFNLMNEVQVLDKSSLSSSVKTSLVKNITLNFKNDVTGLTIFVMNLFFDYVHDFGKNIVTMAKAKFEGFDANTTYLNIFFEWLRRISWLDPSCKNDIKVNIESSEALQTIYNGSMNSGGTIDETALLQNIQLFVYNEIQELNSKNSSNKFQYPFSSMPIGYINNALGSAHPDISFDQSSKASAPAFYASFSKLATSDISLPVITDFGLDQVSNPFTDLMAGIEYIFNAFKQVSRNANLNNLNNRILEKIIALARKFMINDSSSFNVSVDYRGKNIFEYTYQVSPNKEDVNVIFKTWGEKVSGSVLSASALQNVSLSQGIRKTCGDLGIIVYAIAANSIAATGDRAAASNHFLFTYLWYLNRLELYSTDNDGSKRNMFPRFIFEEKAGHVAVPNQPRWLSNGLDEGRTKFVRELIAERNKNSNNKLQVSSRSRGNIMRLRGETLQRAFINGPRISNNGGKLNKPYTFGSLNIAKTRLKNSLQEIRNLIANRVQKERAKTAKQANKTRKELERQAVAPVRLSVRNPTRQKTPLEKAAINVAALFAPPPRQRSRSRERRKSAK